MSKNKYTSAETITMFMAAFHMMSSRTYWPRLRQLSSRLVELGTFNVNVNYSTKKVSTDVVEVSDDIVTLAAAHVRQFIVNTDAVLLDHVFDAVAAWEIRSEHVDEALSQWEQLKTDRLPFRTVDGQSVGVILPENPIAWSKDRRTLGGTVEFKMSLLKFADTMFHEGLFHPYEPGTRKPSVEAYRKVARTVPAVWRDRFVSATLAATVYAAILLHDQIGRLSSEWACGEECWERRHMDLRWAQYKGRTNNSC